jgi:hypothetical protein
MTHSAGHSAQHPAQHPARYTARCTEDLLALVPIVLGFEPDESVVMFTFGGRASFHARVDLPPPDEVDACVSALLAPARRHRVTGVVFVLFGSMDHLVRRTARALRRRFQTSGIRVIDVIQAHDGRWFAPLGRPGVPAHGVPYDVVDHPFRLQAVVEGQVLAASRQELVARLQPDRAAVAAVEDALGRLREERPLDGPALRTLLGRHLVAGTLPDDVESARILLAAHDAQARDQAWSGMRRADAREHVRLWTDLVRRAPRGLVAGAAGVLAFAAWMHGDGATAWCALDRCLEDDPDHSLGQLVAHALERAVPPCDEWTLGETHGTFPRGRAG